MIAKTSLPLGNLLERAIVMFESMRDWTNRPKTCSGNHRTGGQDHPDLPETERPPPQVPSAASLTPTPNAGAGSIDQYQIAYC